MTTNRTAAHAAPRLRIITRRKPNRRPEATTYYPPTEGELSVIAFLASVRYPFTP